MSDIQAKEWAISYAVDALGDVVFAKMYKCKDVWHFRPVDLYRDASKFMSEKVARSVAKNYDAFTCEVSRGGVFNSPVNQEAGEAFDLDYLESQEFNDLSENDQAYLKVLQEKYREEPENFLHLAYSEY